MTESIGPVTGSVISGPDVQAAIWFLGALSQVRVSGAQTGGAFALADHIGPPDFAALAQAAARHQITILAPPPEP